MTDSSSLLRTRSPSPMRSFAASLILTASLVFTTSLTLTSSPLAAQEVLAVKAGRVITMDGGDLGNVTILIENGRITKIGSQVEVPWNAKTIDASSSVVMPTYVLAHSSGGMRGGNENMANVPYLTMQDAVDPSSRFFQECLRNGIGTIHVIPGHRTLIGGQGLIVKPYGQTVEDITVRGKGGLKLSLNADRGGAVAQARKMRRALDDIRETIADLDRRKKEFEAEKAAGATDKKEFDGKIDPTKQPVVDLLKGKNTAHLFVPDAGMLAEALRLLQEYAIDAVLVLGPQTHRAVTALSGLKNPVILDGDLEIDDKDELTDKSRKVCLGALLAKRGIEFALDVGTGTNGADRFPWWQMATLMRHGVDRTTVLRAFTTVPAKVLGINDEVGSITVGKRANLQILTGDPLQATTWVDTVLVDGEIVYERVNDPRLRHLFGLGQETDK